jgi:hypothetical protein
MCRMIVDDTSLPHIAQLSLERRPECLVSFQLNVCPLYHNLSTPKNCLAFVLLIIRLQEYVLGGMLIPRIRIRPRDTEINFYISFSPLRRLLLSGTTRKLLSKIGMLRTFQNATTCVL